MSNYGRNGRDAISVVRIIVSFVIIVISIATIAFVGVKVSEIEILEKINLKVEKHNSINITTDTNVGNSLFVTDEKGLKFRKEDKTFAREEWIEKNAELFYFDTAGYGLNGNLKKEGQIYTFENGKLKNIKRDTSYVARAKDELYSSIESAQYLVWLDSEENEEGFYPIKYKQYSDDTEDFLGTVGDIQYATPNMLKIYMSDIYYLAVGKGANYCGKLYRMRPGAVHKETVGVGVTGFIVLSDEVVYYCDGQRVIKAKSWRGVEVNAIDPEEAELMDALNTLPDAVATDSNFSNVLPNIDVLPDAVDGKNYNFDDNANEKLETIISRDKVSNSNNNINNERIIETRTVKDGRVSSVDAGPKVSQVPAPTGVSKEAPPVRISGLPIPDAKIKIETNDVAEDKSKGVRVNGPIAVEVPN